MSEFNDYSAMIFWNFKRMDNVNYNFEIINSLINSACKCTHNKSHHYKPIFILMMSIIECVLYDFLCRVQEHRYEGVNLGEKEILKIQDIELPKKLKNYTDICHSHNLLSSDDNKKIYQDIFKFIEIRNRMHIQNQKNHAPADEYQIWTINLIKSCGDLIKQLFLHLCANLPRPEQFHNSPDLAKFPEPWKKL